MSSIDSSLPLRIAVIGAGPIGLSLALVSALRSPHAKITVFDASAPDREPRRDARVIALSVGSIQLLQRLAAWQGSTAQAIEQVDVSQQPAVAGLLGGRLPGHRKVRISAAEHGLPMLGAAALYGDIVAALQEAWRGAVQREPDRLKWAPATTVAGLKPLADGVEVDAGVVERFDVAVIAEGGAGALPSNAGAVRRAYRQAAWVGQAELGDDAPIGIAFERFTAHGPVALLPLPGRRSGVVWCVDAQDDPVEPLSDAQRLELLRAVLPREAGPLLSLSPLKRFPLALDAQKTLVDGRIVRIGNAAQTLHPVAGQGLNLGLRDAWQLADALRAAPDVPAALHRFERRRRLDRWTTIAATDLLARVFTIDAPGAGLARGLGLSAIEAISPLKAALARQMMFGQR